MMTNATVWMAFLIAGTVAAAPDGDVPPPAKAVSLSVGDVLPDFGSTADTGEAWKTSDHVGKKYLVLYCYPGDFTGGCTAQAQKYRDTLAKIEQLGAEVVGISGDEVATHKLFKETYGLKHALLSDPKGAVAELLGVPVKAGGKLKATGPDRKPLLDDNGNRIEITRAATLARWTLVVDRAGKIISLKSTVNPVSDAEDVEKLLAAANAGLPAAAAVAAATKESLLATIPSFFSWDYTFEPEPGKRIWMRVDAKTFVERYPSGKENRFAIVGPATVAEVEGIIVQNTSTRGQAFIPGKGDRDMQLKMRGSEQDAWRFMGVMKKVE